MARLLYISISELVFECKNKPLSRVSLTICDKQHQKVTNNLLIK